MKEMFTKYLKESCCLVFDEDFSCKYFPKNALVWKILSNLSGPFWMSKCEWVKSWSWNCRLDPWYFWQLLLKWEWYYEIFEGELLVMFWSTFLPQIFSKVWISLNDLIQSVRMVLADVSINGLITKRYFENYLTESCLCCLIWSSYFEYFSNIVIFFELSWKLTDQVCTTDVNHLRKNIFNLLIINTCLTHSQSKFL